MAAVAPAQVVTGAARAPLPYGLFSILGFRGDEDRWQNGVIFESLTCDPAGGIGNPDCDPEVATVGLPKELDGGSGAVGEATPFTVYGHHTCSPIGSTFARAQELANQHLQVREEARVEQALWTGNLGNVPNFSGVNGYAAPVNLGSLAAWPAVARLEQELALRYGSLGVIHMSRELATQLAKDGDLVRQGGRLFTALGTPIVAGTGYTSERIIGTPALFGFRGEVFSSSNRPGDLLDRGNNDLYAIAERTYLVGFDECALLEVTVIAGGGDVGPAGASAYEVAVANGFEGDEAAWLASLVGADGAEGPEGPQGIPGTDGSDGAPGADGAPGVVQAVVAGDGVAVDSTDPANPVISTTP